MANSKLPSSVPFLVLWNVQRCLLSLRSIQNSTRSTILQASLCALLCFPTRLNAYTVVTISSGAPAGIEQKFIADTTNQYAASYFKNPLASNTYQLQLFGLNPNFNPAITSIQLLNSIVSVDSFTYVYGWASGQAYERGVDITVLESATVNCSTDTVCLNTIGNAINDIYTQNFSTPTTISGF